MDKYVCDTCVYPYAYYNKTEGYQGTQCVNDNNKWSFLKEEPAKTEQFLSACQVRAECICRVPTERCSFTCRDYYISLCNSDLREYGGSSTNAAVSNAIIIVANQTEKCRAFRIKGKMNINEHQKGQGGNRGNNNQQASVLDNDKDRDESKEKEFKLLQDASQNVTFSLNNRDLNFWCPSVTASSSGSSGHGGYFSKRPNVKYAPQEAVIAIDSYCQYKVNNIIAALNAAAAATATAVTPGP